MSLLVAGVISICDRFSVYTPEELFDTFELVCLFYYDIGIFCRFFAGKLLYGSVGSDFLRYWLPLPLFI